ncbi:MAG: NAD(P)-dependent oxidoreductase [Holophagaceae bacterium]
MSHRRILLTGATGFVGRHMVQALLERGDQVVALSRGVGQGLPEEVQQCNLDLEDPASLAMLPRIWDGVIHLAGASIPSLFSTPAPVIVNTKLTMNLLEHLRETKVLLVSSCHVYAPSEHRRREADLARPQGRYGLSKVLTEQLAQFYQGRLDIRVARPFNHVGVGQRPELMLPSLLKRLASTRRQEDAPILMTGWNSIRDFIDVRDVVAAYLAILDLESPSHSVFNVCTGIGTSVEGLARSVLDLLEMNRKVVFQGNPNSSDDVPYLVGDPGLLTETTGWKARHSLHSGLSTMLQSINS